MIKSFVIFVLLLALALAAAVTRPTEQSARNFLVVGSAPGQTPQVLSVAFKDVVAKGGETADQILPPGYEFKDRFLWVDVVKDGQTLYTGVLGHWVKHDAANSLPPVPPANPPAVAGVH